MAAVAAAPSVTSARSSAASLLSSAVSLRTSTTLLPCPGNRLRWNLTASDILQEADRVMAKSKSVYDAIGALNPHEVNVDNVLLALADDMTSYYTVRLPLHFVQHVFSSKDLKEASLAAEKKLSDFDVEISMREDVFNVLLVAQKKYGDALKPEAKRFVERMIISGKRNGLHLSKDIQKKIKGILKQINDLSLDFVKNMNEENTVLEFTKKELDGLPTDILHTLEKTSDDRCKVTLKTPHYLPCMKFVKDPNVRMKLETAFNSRCMKANTSILQKLIKLRHKKAKLLSFPNHAAFVLDMRMVKTTEKVASFLSELQAKLEPLKEEDMRLFLQYKKEDCEKNKREFDKTINLWDTRYYMTRVEERKYAVDHSKLREYFPMPVVTHGLLEIYQELLSLKFELIEGAEVWHQDVTFYSVKDKTSDSLMGYFYLDLYPREGKYGQTACFGLQPGCVLGDGTRQVAIAAMVANFTQPKNDLPALLTHSEVETFFHEFGHVMHQICAETDYVLFSGANVEKDFVETPSQMLENWCWEREPLIRMSSHYKDGSPIPNDLLTALLNSRRANGGILSMWQVLLSTFDLAIHTAAEANTAEMFEQTSKKIVGISPIKGTNTAASFSHMACGYDAQYYGYLWSEVSSADMFYSRFKKDGLRNLKAGMDYRSMILKPGGSMDADEMIRTFLGRDPQPEAFFRVKGFEM